MLLVIQLFVIQQMQAKKGMQEAIDLLNIIYNLVQQ